MKHNCSQNNSALLYFFKGRAVLERIGFEARRPVWKGSKNTCGDRAVCCPFALGSTNQRGLIVNPAAYGFQLINTCSCSALNSQLAFWEVQLLKRLQVGIFNAQAGSYQDTSKWDFWQRYLCLQHSERSSACWITGWLWKLICSCVLLNTKSGPGSRAQVGVSTLF